MCPHRKCTAAASTPESSNESVPSCIPSDPLSQAAYRQARRYLHPAILAHSIRVYLHARHIAQKESSYWIEEDRLPLLFAASIFHDIGTCDMYNTRPLHFEIEGADAAVKFFSDTTCAISESDKHEVWMAIVLHNTPQIAQRVPGLVRLVRLAVMADFKAPAGLALVEEGFVEEVETQFARGKIEKLLRDAVVEQALNCEEPHEKAPAAYWPGELLRAKLENPEWDGVNKGF